jgi:hypothetical protein
MENFNIDNIRAMHAVVMTNSGEELYGWFRWTNAEHTQGSEPQLNAPQLFNPCRRLEDYVTLLGVRNSDTYLFKMEKPITQAEQELAGTAPIADVISFPFGFDYVGSIEDTIKRLD